MATNTRDQVASGLEPIDPSRLYAEPLAKAHIGIEESVWRTLKNVGKLKIMKAGRRNYVLGRDLIEAIERVHQSHTKSATARG